MTPSAASPPAGRQVWAVGALVWLLVEILRGWTPLLITVFGRAAETPPELIGLFVLVVTGLPLVVLALAADRLASGAAVPALVLAALATRLVMPLLGGWFLLVVVSVGVVLALLALTLTVARLGAAVVPGLFTGLAAGATTHAAIGTWGAVHRTDVAGAFATALLVATVVTTLRGHREGVPAAAAPFASPGSSCRSSSSPGSPWPTRPAGSSRGRSGRWSSPPRRRGQRCWLGTRGRSRTARRRAWSWSPRVARAVGSSALVFTVLLFAFYAGYDMGYRADWVVVAVAVVVVAVALTPSGTTEASPAVSVPSRALTLVATAALVAGFGPFATVRPLDGAAAPTDGTVRVAAWNLRMGYGMDGTFRPAEVARVLREEGSDVVLLSEIDRAWLLNGGQDQLGVLARLLGFEMTFGPAGDQVWGDAILSRWPLTEVRNEPLPDYDSLTGATVLSATVTPPKGEAVRVIATHLQPDAEGEDPTLRQARDVAARAKGVTGPVIVGGDFNFEPGSGSWQAMLDAGLVDGLARARPLRTSRSDELTAQIDHVFVSTGLTVSSPRTRTTLLSDHLPVFVDVQAP